MKILHIVAFILVTIGALNWGLMGLGALTTGVSWNPVEMLLSSMPMVENVVYILVGLSGIYLAACHRKDCRCCSAA